MIPLMRQAVIASPIEELLAGREVSPREGTFPDYEGADLVLSVFARTDPSAAGPGIFHAHGGGMVVGDRFDRPPGRRSQRVSR